MKSILLLLTTLAIVACKPASKPAPATGTDPTPAVSPLLAGLLLSDAPDGAVSVTAARKDPAPGKELTVAGDIIGRVDVFVPNRAMLILGDPDAITSCNRLHGDGCATPWDVCCDDPDEIMKSIATIQVLDADGLLVKAGLKGLGNMKELSSIVVQGTVDATSGPDNLIINATGIHIASVDPNNTPPE